MLVMQQLMYAPSIKIVIFSLVQAAAEKRVIIRITIQTLHLPNYNV
jgi:hypothetical protein